MNKLSASEIRPAGMLVLVLALLTAIPARAADSGATEHAGHHDSRHHVETVLGLAWNDGKNAGSIGIEYEYRFTKKYGVAVFLDTTYRGFDLEALGALFTAHPSKGWKAFAGLGSERKLDEGKDKALARLGAAYAFHVGNGSIGPVVAYDFLEDSSDVVYLGVAIGFGF